MKNTNKKEVKNNNFEEKTGIGEEGRKIKNGSKPAHKYTIIDDNILRHITTKFISFLNTGSIPF